MESRDWKQEPLMEGEKDDMASRMRRWEVANNREMNTLTRGEWINTVAEIGAMTTEEAAEYLDALIARATPIDPNNLNMGIDPETFADAIIIGGAYLEAGIRKFYSWSKEMIGTIGDDIRPYLKYVYNALRGVKEARPFCEGMSSFDEVDDSDVDTITVDEETEETHTIAEWAQIKENEAALERIRTKQLTESFKDKILYGEYPLDEMTEEERAYFNKLPQNDPLKMLQEAMEKLGNE